MSIYLLMAISQRTERTATAQRPAMGSQLVAAQQSHQSQMRPMISPQSQMNHTMQQLMVARASSVTPDNKTTFFKLINSAPKSGAHPIHTTHTTHASSALFDDDPGIMSEMETSATGFRRGNKARASLPIVRTPSKTQDRSLGLVFLQYRTETKRALLPNEITSIDTVKALFVRSFPRQLSMEYLDCPVIRIYIHDPSKDMFYELEDLRDVRDRCVLRIYEHGVNGPQPVGGHSNLPIPYSDSEQFGYFSEPEFDSESRHVHRPKRPPTGQPPVSSGQSQYYGTIILPPQYNKAQTMSTRSYMPANAANQPSPHPPERAKPYPGYSQTLPRGAHIMSLYGNLADNNANTTNTTNQTISQTQQRSVSPDLIQKRPKEPIGIQANTCAPPKPQRSFISHSRSPNTSIGPPRSVTSPTLVPPVYHQNRPLPDRPYSAAGHYPSPERGRQYQQDFSGYLSSPECRVPQDTQLRSSYSGYPSLPFEDPYGIYGMRSGAVTPVIDEEARHRMHAMERQLASLTSVVTQALTPAQSAAQQQNQKSDEGSHSAADCSDTNSKCITNVELKRQQFKEEKSVSFMDDSSSEWEQMMHSPQRAAERPTKSAIKSQSRTSISAREKPGKPLPPPKPASLIGYRGEPAIGLTIDMFTQLRQIRKKTKDLRGEMRALRRMALQQTATAKETLRDTCAKIKTTLGFLSASNDCQLRLERLKISHERDSYEQDVYRLDKDLQELESQVEELRSDVINRRCRVNMSHVESMALVLSRASKTVADLKTRYPMLSQTLKTVMTQEMECCVKEEKFLKEEPDRLETALKRCKKLTGTLVTLKRLASVQEQRSTTNQNSSSPSQLLQSVSADTTERDIASRAKRMQSWRRSSNFRDNVNHKIDLWRGFASMPEHTASSQKQSYDIDLEPHTILHVTPGPTPLINDLGKSNVLDTLLDELQTFSKPASTQSSSTTPLSAPLGLQSTARRLVQAMNSVDSPSAKKGPQVSTIPTPPPRSSSRINPIVLSSFTVRPPSYASIRSNSEPPPVSMASRPRSTPPEGIFPEGDDPLVPPSSSTSSLSSVGSQGSVVEKRFAQSRQELLEQRHQELLRKQQQLQEQYTRLQQLSRGQIPRGILNELKKTGSEGNIVSKASMNLNAVHGSLKDLVVNKPNGAIDSQQQKIFETDIL